MRVDKVLYFLGVKVFAAPYDHVLQSAVIGSCRQVFDRKVACMQPAFESIAWAVSSLGICSSLS
jgi:hypothetical protein